MKLPQGAIRVKPTNFEVLEGDISMKRDNDRTEELHFRSERILRINGEWYFLTREGQTKGPYANKNIALEHLESYLEGKLQSAD